MNLAALRSMLASAMLLFAGQALAQGQFKDATNDAIVHTGVVQMCLDANGKAIPAINGGNCGGAGGAGGGLSVTDRAAWAQGTSAFTPSGGVYNDSATLSVGQQGTFRLTADRQLKVLDSAVVAAVAAPVAAGTNDIGFINILGIGQTADAAVAVGAAGSLNSKMRLLTTQIDTLNTNMIAAVPTGANIIGKVGFDQTTPGTTNLVSIGTNGTVALNAALPSGTNTIGNVGRLPYPVGSVPYTNSATGTTAGAAATLAGAASVTTYLCGFSVRANATAVATVNTVVSGTISGSLNFTEWVAPNTSGLGIAEMIFNPCIPASAANTSIVVTGGAPGTGGVNSTTAWGYKL